MMMNLRYTSALVLLFMVVGTFEHSIRSPFDPPGSTNPNPWVQCAKKGGWCSFEYATSTPTTYTVRYGAEDHWSFIQATQTEVPCWEDTFGNFKDMPKNPECYSQIQTDQQAKNLSSMFDGAKEYKWGEQFNVGDSSSGETAMVRVGLEPSQWGYAEMQVEDIKCNGNVLGYDPGSSQFSVCQVSKPIKHDWIEVVSDAGGDYNFPLTNAIHRAMYRQEHKGNTGRTVRVVSMPKLYCDTKEFNVPSGGVDAYERSADAQCYIDNTTIFEFSPTNGTWVERQFCGGQSTCSFSIQVGVSSTSTDSTTTSWSSQYSESTDEGIFFANAKMNVQVSTSVTTSVSTAYSHSVVETCSSNNQPKNTVLWQWQQVANEVNWNSPDTSSIVKAFTTFTCEWLTLSQGKVPQCPPGYCKDSECQKCTSNIY